MRVSVVIPAYREADRIGATVAAVRQALAERPELEAEVLVVDDGSPDSTASQAEAAGARVRRLPRNGGKGGALTEGFRAATGDLLLMLDADLGESARQAVDLLSPLLDGRADMTVAAFPPNHGGGMGLVKALAAWGLRRAGAPAMQSPLSGQRGMTRAAWERLGRLESGFGLEMGLNLDAARAGLRVLEVPTEMTHRVTGKDWTGYRHRARQFRDIVLALWRRRRARG